MAIKTDTVKGLAYWASYLVNGDHSGLSDSEVAECDKWQRDILDGWYVVGTEGEPFMGWMNGLQADCIYYVVHKRD